MSFTPFLPFKEKVFELPTDLVAPTMPIEATTRPYDAIPLYGGLISTPSIMQKVHGDVVSLIEANNDITLETQAGSFVQLLSLTINIVSPEGHSLSQNRVPLLHNINPAMNISNGEAPPSFSYSRKFKTVDPNKFPMVFRDADGIPSGNKYYVYANIGNASGPIWRITLGVGEGAAFAPGIGFPIYGHTSGSSATLVDVQGDVLLVTSPSVGFPPNPNLNVIFQTGENIADCPAPGPCIANGTLGTFTWPVVYNVENVSIKVTATSVESPIPT